jgi:hypothetical protein
VLLFHAISLLLFVTIKHIFLYLQGNVRTKR